MPAREEDILRCREIRGDAMRFHEAKSFHCLLIVVHGDHGGQRLGFIDFALVAPLFDCYHYGHPEHLICRQTITEITYKAI